ncbi:hypothetical protein F2Q69_00011277 [Brassica cretica]|uniref:Uncharacterized protein n=1 Tax=Brassica cretica TaxID=69181 RepID=A0A8S9QNY8_BRACR|nr:hypothetical protein F2Q69_00011277 [Brassica cretica]
MLELVKIVELPMVMLELVRSELVKIVELPMVMLELVRSELVRIELVTLQNVVHVSYK